MLQTDLESLCHRSSDYLFALLGCVYPPCFKMTIWTHHLIFPEPERSRLPSWEVVGDQKKSPRSQTVQKLFPKNPMLFGHIWVSLKIVYPIVPNGFADHYPYEKWLFHWGYTLFSDIPIFWGSISAPNRSAGHLPFRQLAVNVLDGFITRSRLLCRAHTGLTSCEKLDKCFSLPSH